MEVIILFLIILPGLLLSSCRRLEFSTIDFQEREQYPGAGIGVSAQFLSDPEEINQLFHTFLPDSGIIPVQVGVRNNDTTSIVINGSSFPGLREKIGGISLVVEGEEFIPLNPFEVMETILGDKVHGYRQKGFGSLVAGTIFPPLGSYYIYDEATRGRVYRGLVGNSFYRLDEQYFFQPLSLEPGEEKTGYLYFPLPMEISPYEIVSVPGGKKGDKILKEIKVKDHYDVLLSIKTKAIPAKSDFGLNGSQQNILSFYDICFDKQEYGDIGKISGFLLREGRRGGAESKLVFVEFPYPPGRPVQPEKEMEIDDIHTVAKIADVVVGSDFAACGVNFTRKSRVYFIGRGNEGASLPWRMDMERKILRLVAVDDALLAICDNGFCYYLSEKDGKIGNRYIKFAADVDDIFCYSGKLGVFGNKKLKIYSIDSKNFFDKLNTFEISDAERKVVGNIDDGVVLLYRSKGMPGDTLVLINPENAHEICRMPLPGRVSAANCRSKIVVQLRSGVILQFAMGQDAFLLQESSLLPYPADELVVAGDTVFVATEEGVVDLFNLKDKLFSPPSFSHKTRVVPSPVRKKYSVGNE
ncbi:hypothetical protein J7M07_06595 [bacterium]|nr:hypothetical protein [bacterium]